MRYNGSDSRAWLFQLLCSSSARNLTDAHKEAGYEGTFHELSQRMKPESTIFNPNTSGSLWTDSTQHPQGRRNSLVCHQQENSWSQFLG
jgi:hypothetical protein